MKRFVLLLTCTSLLISLISCGTILYPERKGQVSGQLDTGVVVLNAVGLLLFFVPGVIAFAVDFSNGTIYLPKGTSSKLSSEEMDHIALNGKVDMNGLYNLISEKVAPSVLIDSNKMQVRIIKDIDELAGLFGIYSKRELAAL